MALMADGVGGSKGEIASRLAVATRPGCFLHDRIPRPTRQGHASGACSIAASKAIYDDSLQNRRANGHHVAGVGFPANKVTIRPRGGLPRLSDPAAKKIERLTTDHSTTAGLRVKLGLILEHDAMTSPYRSLLTRSMGNEPMCRLDFVKREVS